MELELEKLKQIWKSHEQGYELKKESEIAFMLKGKSRSIIDKLKRNIWIELLLTITSGIVLGIYSLTLEYGAVMWIIISLIVLFIGYSFYYVKKLRLLNRFDSSYENLKDNLQHLHERLTAYLNSYKMSFTILYPLYFCLGLLFPFLDLETEAFLTRLRNPSLLITLFLLAVFFFIHVTILTNLYLKKLYGRHIDKLKELLQELEVSINE